MNNFTANFPSRLTSARSRSRGVGLIEVMIAMLILAIGFLALASLQTAATRAAAEARARTASVNLATDKLEEMRSFVNRVANADGVGGADNIIDTDGDGRADAVGRSFDQIAAGNDTPNEVGAGTVGYTFTRNWTAVPCRVAISGAVTCGGTITAITADFMRVAVRVRWSSPDVGAATQEIVVEDVISSSTPIDAAVAMSTPAIDRQSPKVYIQPARIQSTIPIAIGDGLASAASDPQPTIIRDNIVRTQFEVLTFATTQEGLLAERAFDYTVVGCDCTLRGVVSAAKSFEPTVWNGLTFSRPREVTNGQPHPDPNVSGNVSRVVADPILRNSDPPVIKDLCTACCRDHHDTRVASTPLLDPTKLTGDDPATTIVEESQYLSNGDHRHYLPVLDRGVYTFREATAAGDQYYESCRFLRRDGFYRLTMDAHLVDLSAFRAVDLDETAETADYATFARQLIDSYVNRAAASGSAYPRFSAATMAAIYNDGKTTPLQLSTTFTDKLDPPRNYPLPSPGQQQLSRGIYVDYMSPEVLAAIRCKINNTPDTEACLPYRAVEKLELVPFFAVGMTRLNNWQPEKLDNSDPPVWRVNSVHATMPLRDAADAFSRGWAVPRSEGTVHLAAQSAVTNIGLTNPIPGSALEQAQSLVDRQPVEIGLVATLPPERVIVNFTINRANGTLIDDAGVVRLGGTGVICLQQGQQAGAFSWTCQLSSQGRGVISFSNYTGTECLVRDGGTCVRTGPVRNQLCFSPLPARVTELRNANLYLDQTDTEFDGSQAANAGYAVDVIPASGTCPQSDRAPGVSATSPSHDATEVSTNATLSVDFNEFVNVTAGAVTLTCNGGANLITGGTSGSNINRLTPTYTGPLPLGATCTLTVLAANVTDVDTIDPPNNMGANYQAIFRVSLLVIDTPPQVVGNADRSIAGRIIIDFSEPVDVRLGGITLTCGGSNLITSGTGVSNVSRATVLYTAPLPSGAACTLTAINTLITDVDVNDPPDMLDGNRDGIAGDDYVLNFTAPIVDEAPRVLTATRTAGAFSETTQFTVTFSEAVDPIIVNATDASAITLFCGNRTQRFASAVLNPNTTITMTQIRTGNPRLPCTLTVKSNGVGDLDLNDPPNFMVADFVQCFNVDGTVSAGVCP